MNNNLIARASITINASAERVWDALVNPEAIKQYMFGTNVATDWREGSPITWKGEWQGKSYEDKGVILRFEPPRVLQYSHFSPLSGLPDESENYHTVTIELSGEGHQTRVSLSQDNNATEEARKHSEKMWGMMLEELKKFVEQAMNKQIKEQLPIGYWLKRADKLLTQRIDDAQRSNGLSRLAWQTLNIIFQRGTVMRDDIVSTLQTFANHATIDGVIGELVVRGLVGGSFENGFNLTTAGKELYDKALLVQRSIRQQAVAGITEAEYATTINVLQRLVANLEHNETVYSASVSSEQLKNQDQISVRKIREGFHTVTPYLLVEGADRLIEFLSTAFDAEILDRKFRPDGTVMHAELRIGDSMVMLGESSSEFRPMSASIYLYVPDWDRVYQQALAAGGESVFAIRNLPSGERYGGVKDPCGNIWWIATHIEDVSPEEEERRWREFFRL